MNAWEGSRRGINDEQINQSLFKRGWYPAFNPGDLKLAVVYSELNVADFSEGGREGLEKGSCSRRRTPVWWREKTPLTEREDSIDGEVCKCKLSFFFWWNFLSCSVNTHSYNTYYIGGVF